MTDFPEKIDSKFRFVLVAAQRAEQLLRGARPRTDIEGKVAIVAMKEVEDDLVVWDYGPRPVQEPVEAAEDEGAEEADEEVN